MSNIEAGVAENIFAKFNKRVFIFDTWHTGKEKRKNPFFMVVLYDNF